MDGNALEQLRTTLFPDNGESTYAVLDGAACEELLEKITELEPEHCCLYAGELEPDVEECAPYLVQLEQGHPFTEWLLAEMPGKPWGIFAHSPAEIRALRKHFRTFLLVKGPDGEMLYFRYYDPRVLSIYLPTTNAEERETVFGELSIYFCELRSGDLVGYRRDEGQLQTLRLFQLSEPVNTP